MNTYATYLADLGLEVGLKERVEALGCWKEDMGICGRDYVAKIVLSIVVERCFSVSPLLRPLLPLTGNRSYLLHLHYHLMNSKKEKKKVMSKLKRRKLSSGRWSGSCIPPPMKCIRLF